MQGCVRYSDRVDPRYGSVRITEATTNRVFPRICSEKLPAGRARGLRHPESGVFVLDVVYILGILAVFVVVGLIAKGVEKL